MVMLSDLLEDLESEILSRVPTKSLVKLKTTCKRWYLLFKDPHFVKKNLGKSAREVILHTGFDVYSISVNLHGIHKGIDPSMECRGKLCILEDSQDLKISDISHYHGLILCVTEGNTRLDVWNPCTGETRRVKPRSCQSNIYVLGCGNNNSSCPSYKILRFRRYYKEDKGMKVRAAEYEIYDFSSDSWRVLDGYPDDWDIETNLSVSLKENAYWTAFDKETGFFLVYFDFTTERFGSLPLPYQSHNHQDSVALSVVKDERLSVLYQNFSTHPQMLKIWVTNKFVDTKDMTWSNFFVLDFDKFMLPSLPNVISFLLDEENKVAVCCDSDPEGARTRIFIIGEDFYKEPHKEVTEGISSNWPLLVSYVPTLVHI